MKSYDIKNAYEIFNSELGKLAFLLKAGSYSFNEFKVEDLKKFLNEDEVSVNLKNLRISTQPFKKPQFKEKELRSRLSFGLRELLFVRLISALEVYLVDNVRDIFKRDNSLFKVNTKFLTISHAELLSAKSLVQLQSKIINKTCRSLSQGGFSKTVKYYKTNFQIELNSLEPGISKMIEYHDKRHLLVHRLGKTDAEYRRKYNIKKFGISFNEKELIQVFTDFKFFVDETQRLTENYIKSNITSHKNSTNNSSIFRFKNANAQNLPKFISPDFSFWVNEKIITYADLNPQIEIIEDTWVQVKVSEEPIVLKRYLRIVKNICKGNSDYDDLHVIVHQSEYVDTGHNKKRISNELLRNVKNMLPEEPWPKGIHKEIAEELGTSNTLISNCIDILMEEQRQQSL